MNKQRISIVMPSYNQGGYIEGTLCSLLNQNDSDVEIIVIDGGSDDGSVEVIKRYQENLAYWVSEKDEGQSDAINKGFEKSTGEWLAWLNSDDELLPNAIGAYRQAIDTDPKKRWWIGGGWFIDEKGKRIRPFSAPHGLTRPEQLSDWRSLWLAQPSTLFRRSLWEDCGGHVRQELHYAMDLELWLRFLATAEPGIVQEDISAFRLYEESKTSRLVVDGEAEVVRVLVEHVGVELALDRVRGIAWEREQFRRRLNAFGFIIKPMLSVHSMLKRLANYLKKDRVLKTNAGED